MRRPPTFSQQGPRPGRGDDAAPGPSFILLLVLLLAMNGSTRSPSKIMSNSDVLGTQSNPPAKERTEKQLDCQYPSAAPIFDAVFWVALEPHEPWTGQQQRPNSLPGRLFQLCPCPHQQPLEELCISYLMNLRKVISQPQSLSKPLVGTDFSEGASGQLLAGSSQLHSDTLPSVAAPELKMFVFMYSSER
ncbi:unnamed protein product [Urochloa humidicola]